MRSLSSKGWGVGKPLSEVAFVVAWSSGFVGTTLGTQFAPASTLLAWRFFFASALVLGWVLVMRRGWPGGGEVGMQVVLGLLSQVVYLGCVVGSAEVGVSGGIAALIAALQPLFAVALAGPLLGESVRWFRWLGLAVGFAGVALVVGGDARLQANLPIWAYALPFVGMMGLVATTLVEQRKAWRDLDVNSGMPLNVSLAIQFAISAVVFGCVALARGELTPPGGAGFWIVVA